MRNAFVATLSEIAEEDPDLWLMCGDLGFSVLEHFAERHPNRYINAGVAEQNMAGMAAGIALSGKTVFIYSIGNFPTLRCLEQLRNDVCYHGADVKVVSVGAGFAYGSQGYTHHAIEDVAIMGALPGMDVYVPCDPAEAKVATRIMAASGRPSYLRLSRAGEPTLHATPPTDLSRPLELRSGKDVVVLASGPVASLCLEAADALASEGIGVAIYSVPRLKPFDDDFARDLAGAAAPIITVEEHILRGGLYAAVAAAVAPLTRHAAISAIGIAEQPAKPSRGGGRDAQMASAGISAEAIAAKIRTALSVG